MKERARRKAQRPGEILEAAFDAFAERGFAATRMEDVAARAGVTKGAIYFYFPTKERLFEEMVDHYSRDMLADAGAMLASAQGGSAEKLRAFLEFMYGRCARDRYGREIIRLMVSDGKSFPQLVERHHRDFFAPAMRMVSELLAAGAASGEFRPEVAKHGAEIVVAPSVFLTLMRLIFGGSLELNEDAYIVCHIELLLNGLLTPSGRANLSPAKACGEDRSPI
ncbi:TetR/AcrR family transcriptional regulator [Rhodoblastus acidophilus]|uniref:TetR/AcrR family transcriptional regulator n=1 Tax=Candidatus Rhodoblastus alkanivorans TaxID=2954117 RepID=A0ABS9ZAR4_9HYPH|nr:TetR/AcrR family transcriptional regulator [Candidatus Rhodoblastus alkanivorans]MCI4677759.1 TetR/AcrR family transcriptional regulator [Candidatus Rhodoblastus alkanivorans]MCI4684743.1 TetR/AcrR family transcriptional regulator [Candidatus Rhodoblastus alkanivorans]MDI4642065.1 TetR/AcrR family transcriptional regulator [Rhodoblastus acidophilus]